MMSNYGYKKNQSRSYLNHLLYYERVLEHGTVDIVMKRHRRLRQTMYILFVTYICYESVTEDGRGDRHEE